jgi:F-type H+-transporting ATPase subunit delta
LPAGLQSAKHDERKNAKLAGETTLVAGIAGRYAIALFELARDENKLDETAQELTGLQALLDESEDFARLVRSPIFSAAEQTQAVAEIAQKAGLSPLTANFLKILAKNRRLFTLTGVIAGFRKLLADHRNELEADIASAVPLTDAQTEELKATLKAKTGKDISLNSRVDPALLGGLIVKIGSRMIDNSVRTKLNNLKMAMKEVG